MAFEGNDVVHGNVTVLCEENSRLMSIKQKKGSHFLLDTRRRFSYVLRLK